MAKKKTIETKPVTKMATPIYTQLVVRPIYRTINDIGNWKQALRSADYGNRSTLYDLYSDILLDGVLTDAIDKRIDAVKNADLSFTIDNNDVDVMYDLIDTVEFENLIGEIMMAKFWGITVDEFFFNTDNTFGFNSLPRKNLIPAKHEVAINVGDEKGIPYENDPLVIQWGGDNDLGLLLKIAPLIIYKRGGFGDYAQFVELFGMPQRIGKYNSMDESSRRQLIEALDKAGSASYLVIPKETEVETSNSSATGNGNVYENFRKACSEELLITVLGQTMTTTDGSSLAQGQVHMAVEEKKHRADRRYVERMLNRYFVPLLIQRGYPITGGKFKFLDNKRELEVSEIVQLADIMPIPQSYLHERYNIPLPQDDEPIAKRNSQQDVVDDKTDTEPIDKDDAKPKDDDTKPARPTEKKVEKEDVKNSSWISRIKDFFVQAPAQIGASNFAVPTNLKDETLADRLIKQVAQSKGKALFNEELYWFIANDLIDAADKGFNNGNNKKLFDQSFVYNATDDAYRTAMEANLFRFSAAKAFAEVEALNQAFTQCKSFAEFNAAALDIVQKYNRDWQRTEYNTAVTACENAQTYRRLFDKKDIFPYWQYKTAGDERVREEHRALAVDDQGQPLILPATDPLWDEIYPPNGWNCRCYVVPRMKHELPSNYNLADMQQRVKTYKKTDDWKNAVRGGWNTNRATKAGVFTANQMYIKDFDKKEQPLLDNLKPIDWGIKETLEDLIKKAKEKFIEYFGTVLDWWTNNKGIEAGKEVVRFKDHIGRIWTLSKDDFMKHAATKRSKYANRLSYVNGIKDTIRHPDEVWLRRHSMDVHKGIPKIDDYIWVKYYKNFAFACVGNINNNGRLVIKSWFGLNKTSSRNGILLYLKKNRLR